MKKLWCSFFVCLVALDSCTDQNLQSDQKRSNSLSSVTSNHTTTITQGCPSCAPPNTCVNGECAPPCDSNTCDGQCVNGQCQPCHTTCDPGYTPVNCLCTTPGCPICGAIYSDTYSTIHSYHQYTEAIDASCLVDNEHMSISCVADAIPNRFTIYDANNNYITSSGWVGYANYPGPWGMSLSTPYDTYLLVITKVTSSYRLVVETETPPDYSYSPNVDYWSAAISCYQ